MSFTYYLRDDIGICRSVVLYIGYEMDVIINMEKGVRIGIFFGTTSGVITTSGLLVGLHAGTESLAAVLGGILIIAVADSMSDALGIHLAEESDSHSDTKQVWLATLVTFVSKFIVSLSFAVPLLIFPLDLGVMIAVLWGMLILIVLSWQLARAQGTAVLPVVGEHLAIAVGVVVLSYFVGTWVNRTF